MKGFNIRRLLKAALLAVVLLAVIGIICDMNATPLSAITGATAEASGLQEDGALTHLIKGDSR